MSVSTDGIICYGVLFDEDAEFPWDNEEFDHDVEKWWRSTQGYQEAFAVTDWETLSAEKATEYFNHREEWDRANPCPFEPVNYCSGEWPMYILAVPDTVTVANRGHPKPLPECSWVDGAALLAAILGAGIKLPKDAEPEWWLCSYWG